MAAIIRRGEAALGVELAEDAREAAVHSAGGDARNALNILEAAVGAAGDGPVTPEHVRDAARKRPLLYDKGGDQHYDVISAFIKSMRGSDTDASIYYLAVMLEGGEDPRFVARRMVVFASEDVGQRRPARARGGGRRRPRGRVRRDAGVPHQPEPGGRVSRPGAEVERLVRRDRLAPCATCASAATCGRRRALRDASYAGAKRLGHGAGYVYPHDRPEEAAKQQYLPDELAGTRYYPEDAPGPEPAGRRRTHHPDRTMRARPGCGVDPLYAAEGASIHSHGGG